MDQNKILWIALIAVIVLGIITLSIIYFTQIMPMSSERAIFSTPVSTVQSLPTTTALPTATPVAAAGDIWVVQQVKVGQIQNEGFTYDVYLFANERSPQLTMKANCMAPKWPAPVVGDRFLLNPWGVLVPCGNQSPCVTGDVNSPLQRFWPLK